MFCDVESYVSVLHMCVEYFLSDGGCVFHFSILASGKKKKNSTLSQLFHSSCFRRTNIFQQSWESAKPALKYVACSYGMGGREAA